MKESLNVRVKTTLPQFLETLFSEWIFGPVKISRLFSEEVGGAMCRGSIRRRGRQNLLTCEQRQTSVCRAARTNRKPRPPARLLTKNSDWSALNWCLKVKGFVQLSSMIQKPRPPPFRYLVFTVVKMLKNIFDVFMYIFDVHIYAYTVYTSVCEIQYICRSLVFSPLVVKPESQCLR